MPAPVDSSRRRVRPPAGGEATPTALGAARKVAVAAAGATVLTIGVALIVLPGPAIVVIPAGLAILATEFLWARRLLTSGKERVGRLLGRGRVTARAGGKGRPAQRRSR